MDKVLEILTTIGGLLVKLLDFYSGLYAQGILRTALGLALLALIAAGFLLFIKPLGYLLLRPFLRGVSDWSASLTMQRREDTGTPKPYVLHMHLSMRELFRKALADMGLYGRTDTDALCGFMVRKSRNLSEDANHGSLQGLVRRSDALRRQSARYLDLVRGIERERSGRLSQRQDYYADATHLEEMDLPSHPGEVRKGFLQGLFAAMMYNRNGYHAFRNLLRSGSLRPDGTVMRFHTESAREHFADRMQRSLDNGVPYVLYVWLLSPGGGFRFSVIRYLFRSAGKDKLSAPETLRGSGYEIRFESERGRQNQASFRFEIVTSGTALHHKLQEIGTREIMAWASGKAAIEGVLMGNAVVLESGSMTPRQLVSDRYRLDNSHDRHVFANAIGQFVAMQAETVAERPPVRGGSPKGGSS